MDTIHLKQEGKPLMIAHRGVSGLEKENTMPAFVAAGNRSYYGIETDIHKTADGTKTLALSIPTRYLHSPSCVCSIDDYTSQKQLCEAIIRNILEVI